MVEKERKSSWQLGERRGCGRNGAQRIERIGLASLFLYSTRTPFSAFALLLSVRRMSNLYPDENNVCVSEACIAAAARSPLPPPPPYRF